jgi:hypothetical protein
MLALSCRLLKTESDNVMRLTFFLESPNDFHKFWLQKFLLASILISLTNYENRFINLLQEACSGISDSHL